VGQRAGLLDDAEELVALLGERESTADDRAAGCEDRQPLPELVEASL